MIQVARRVKTKKNFQTTFREMMNIGGDKIASFKKWEKIFYVYLISGNIKGKRGKKNDENISKLQQVDETLSSLKINIMSLHQKRKLSLPTFTEWTNLITFQRISTYQQRYLHKSPRLSRELNKLNFKIKGKNRIKFRYRKKLSMDFSSNFALLSSSIFYHSLKGENLICINLCVRKTFLYHFIRCHFIESFRKRKVLDPSCFYMVYFEELKSHQEFGLRKYHFL